MRCLSVVSVMCVVSAVAIPQAQVADDDVKKQAELKWARGVTDDFLKALKKQDDANVEALLTPEYAKLLEDRTYFNPKPAPALYKKTKAFDKATIAAEDISPDRDEAVFKGEFESASGTQGFALRVIKDKVSGRWRVGLMQVEDEKPNAKPKDPNK